MRMQNRIIRNRFNKYSKRHLPADRHIQLNMKTDENWTESATRRFIDNHIQQNEQWREIISQYKQSTDETKIKTDSSETAVKRILKPAPTSHCSAQVNVHRREYNLFNINNGINYRFANVDTLDVNNISEIMLFANPSMVRVFLQKLNPGVEKLAAIVKEFDIKLPASGFSRTEKMLTALTNKLISGNIVILIEKKL